MQGKKVNVEVVEQTDTDHVYRLMEGLEKIDGFDFLVDIQFKIHQTNPETDDHT